MKHCRKSKRRLQECINKNIYNDGRKSGFTLLELLVVIAIIMILASILLPSLQNVKYRSQELICKSNMRQCGLSMQSYINDHNAILPLGSYAGAGSSKTWIEFINGDIGGEKYLTNNNVSLCPSFAPGKYTTRSCTYGSHPEGNIPGAFVPAGYSNGPFIRVSGVSSPSTLWLLEDSVKYSTADSKYMQTYYVYFNPASNTNGGVHLRHFDGANFSFLDGHVDSVKKKKIRTLFNIVKGYYSNNCSLIDL